MIETVFVAGATGAIGSVLVPLLVDAGYRVVGSTRRPERVAAIEAMGATAAVVDVFDAAALLQAVRRAEPAIVVHQLTDLPPALDPARMADAVARNARIRDEGTRNLVGAAVVAGATRLVAQSIAWAYAPGSKPYQESQPLDLAAEGARAISIAGVASLERQVLANPALRGAVLRYGNLYGPRTGRDAPSGACPVHVEAAAWAALLAVQQSASGIFNIAEDGNEVSSDKAKRELSWSAAMRLADRANANADAKASR